MEYDRTKYYNKLFQSKILLEENNRQNFSNVQKHE